MNDDTCKLLAYVATFTSRHPEEEPDDRAFFESLCDCAMCAEGTAASHEAEDERNLAWELRYRNMRDGDPEGVWGAR